MHEAAAMRSVVGAIVARAGEAGAARVTRVRLVLGASSHLTESAARQYYAVFAAGTPAAAADLEIAWLPATYQCLDCPQRFEDTRPPAQVVCPACGAEPGQPCRAVGGMGGWTLSQPHAARTRSGMTAGR